MPGKRRPDSTANVTPEENKLFIMHALAVEALPPIDTDDAEAVYKRILEYFRMCIDSGLKPNLAGMAHALGVERQTITLWEGRDGGRMKKPDDVIYALKRGRVLLNELMEMYMNEGKINPIAGIFLMKNNLGYSNADSPSEQNVPVEQLKSMKDLEARYLASAISTSESKQPEPEKNGEGREE